MKKIATLLLAILPFLGLSAQVRTDGETTRIDGMVELDHTVHDFGDVITRSGPLSCTFTVTNISDKPMAIYTVGSSCGCTDVKWTREPIQAGGKGTISATYTNDEGPYNFDKTLTVSFSNLKKPVILRLRGSAHEKQRPLSELFPVAFGPIAFKSDLIRCGNITQGSQRSGSVSVANLGKKPVDLDFVDVAPGLELSVSPNPVPAGGTSRLTWTITTDRDHWGRNEYNFTPLVGGKHYKGDARQLRVQTFTIEDFSAMSKEQKASAAQPYFEESTANLGIIPYGSTAVATFTFRNNGKKPLHIYKADADWRKVSFSDIPDTAPGAETTFTVNLDTTGLPEGEFLVILTLTTDTPLRPMINLFISGATTH